MQNIQSSKSQFNAEKSKFQLLKHSLAFLGAGNLLSAISFLSLRAK